jgi:DNA-binding NarL/FixJ family response regulator
MDVRPNIPIIICSGFTQRLSRQKAMDMGVSEFLMKPLLIKDLAYAVRKVLDGK